jgi:hypothetical protein
MRNCGYRVFGLATLVHTWKSMTLPLSRLRSGLVAVTFVPYVEIMNSFTKVGGTAGATLTALFEWLFVAAMAVFFWSMKVELGKAKLSVIVKEKI